MKAIRVLVLDDDVIIRETLAAYFEDNGLDATEAGSAEEALEAISGGLFDVCVVDIRLSGIDGDEFIGKASELRPGLRFLIHTGSPTYAYTESLINVGLTSEHIFKKPVKVWLWSVGYVQVQVSGLNNFLFYIIWYYYNFFVASSNWMCS